MPQYEGDKSWTRSLFTTIAADSADRRAYVGMSGADHANQYSNGIGTEQVDGE